MNRFFVAVLLMLICINTCEDRPEIIKDPKLEYQEYTPKSTDIVINRIEYAKKLQGFWLGQCIANWTGLITEMDKIGGDGKDGKAAGFYTREDWGGPDEPNLWGGSGLSDTIDFYLNPDNNIWGADDDTDIEYIYQHLLYTNETSILTPEQIRDGWLKHIKKEEENYLWVSNQQAYDLMQKGILPPETSSPELNPHYEMIDAQLTTEIFGLFSPTRPDFALKMADLPIHTSARDNAARIAEFYVIMHSLASAVDDELSMQEKLTWMADEARLHLPDNSYSAKMYDFVKAQYASGVPWETARDRLHEKYQVRQEDGYKWSTKDETCNGCFAAGINFGASIISLLYGEGDLKETIKIGVLCGWDSDNPTATWGGLIGFMIGREGVEKAFGQKFTDKFNIHRTRIGFLNDGLDTFENMAKIGVFIIDRVVQHELQGGVDLKKNVWYVPNTN